MKKLILIAFLLQTPLLAKGEICSRERDLYRKTVKLQNEIISQQSEDLNECKGQLDGLNDRLTDQKNKVEAIKRRCLLNY